MTDGPLDRNFPAVNAVHLLGLPSRSFWGVSQRFIRFAAQGRYRRLTLTRSLPSLVDGNRNAGRGDTFGDGDAPSSPKQGPCQGELAFILLKFKFSGHFCCLHVVTRGFRRVPVSCYALRGHNLALRCPRKNTRPWSVSLVIHRTLTEPGFARSVGLRFPFKSRRMPTH